MRYIVPQWIKILKVLIVGNKRKFLKLYFQKLSNQDQEFQKSRFSFYQQKILNLPQDLRQMISLKAQATREAKQEHIMQFLAGCSTFGVTIQGMSFIWQSHYGNTNNEYPKLDPLCGAIPLERQDCKIVSEGTLTIFARPIST